jgi:hypothetical protein
MTSDQPGNWAPPPYGWAPYPAPQAPRPGVIPLRPLELSDLLDGAINMIRRYPAATLGFAAAVMLVVETIRVIAFDIVLRGVRASDLTVLFGVSFGAHANNGHVAAANNIVTVVTLAATILLTGMLAAVTGDAALGRPMGIRSAWKRLRPTVLRLVGATICVGLAVALSGFVGA